MLLRQRGAERRDRAVKAVLVQRDGVHVALGEDDPSLLAFFRNVQGEEIFPFVEDDRLGRIEIFGRRVVHHAPAEADDVAAHIDDREHQPVAEAVVNAALLRLDREARLEQLFLGVALFDHRVQQRRPLVG